MFWEGSKYGVEKYTFTDADVGDLSDNERIDDDEDEGIDCGPTVNFSVWYSVVDSWCEEEKNYSTLMWHISWQAGHMVRTSDGNVIVKDQ